MKQATSVDELFQYVDEIIGVFRAQGSRMGYFPVVYRYVAATLRAYNQQGRFRSPALMDRMALGLFNRYFAALQLYQAGELPSRAWLAAFEAADSRWPTVSQQIMLSINPHINLDLGIVVARICPGDQLPGFRDEFFKMNGLLAPLIVDIVSSLDAISPIAGLFRGRGRAAAITFLVDQMGAHAWRVAERLALLDEAAQSRDVASLDGKIAKLGRLIAGASPTLALFRLTERGTVAEIMDTLSQIGGGVDAGH